ncbi:lipoprotein-releasing system permease protein [Parelusimicrobium proximum]|uniref:ABC transporter permease n=1 Tax=Parelusimicrobium proximum TaxID=3228953 RepID=UPI003D1654A6
MKYELFVAVRYLNSKRKGLFSIITTLIGIAGVAVGVAALITTLAVMSGFHTDIKDKIIGAQSHILIFGRMPEGLYQEKMAEIEAMAGVAAAAPQVYGQAILTADGASTGLVLRGLDPEKEKNINTLMTSFVEGSFEAVKKDDDKSVPEPLVVGNILADNMGFELGDDVVLISPSSISTSAGVFPKMKKFRISGIIKTGYGEFDSSMGYTTLSAAADFLNIKGGVTGIAVKLHNMDDAERIAGEISERLRYGYQIRTFAQLNSTLYAALKLEKAMMFIILSLIIFVASLNIASNLILMGTEKLRDIGMMRAMGASPARIRKIFIFEGLMIATAGIVCGIILAGILCWVIATFDIVQLPPDIYYLSKVPVRINASDVASVIIGSYILCFIAALYPAIRASRVNPTDAIRYG